MIPLAATSTDRMVRRLGGKAAAVAAARNEYAFATFEKSVYLSKDVGRIWMPIAVRGNGD